MSTRFPFHEPAGAAGPGCGAPPCRRLLPWLAAAVVLAAPLCVRAAGGSPLLDKSPFLPPASAAAAAKNTAAEAPAQLEFRGITSINGENRFIFFDLAKQKGVWVGEKDEGKDYKVLDYKPETGTVQVSCRGETLTLVLKKDEFTSSPMLGGGPPILSGPQPAAQAMQPGAAQDRRDQRISENRRRRAMRQAGAGAPPPGSPGASPIQGPVPPGQGVVTGGPMPVPPPPQQ